MDDATTPSARERHQTRAALQFDSISSVVRVIAGAAAIALTLRTLVLEPFNIPSESMLPTLQAGDYLFVAKWPYGISRYSLPQSPPLFSGRIGGGTPARGDVVVFKTPRDNRTDFIKRVAGLPGDRVRMIGGQLEINGVRVSKIKTGDFLVAPSLEGTCHGDGQVATGLCRYPRFIEQIDHHRYAVLDEIANDPRDNTSVVTVPAGHYFVMGDNRDDSADSRLSIADGGVGMVPAENLIGRAEVIFFSTGTATPGTSWWSRLRLDRIGTRL